MAYRVYLRFYLVSQFPRVEFSNYGRTLIKEMNRIGMIVDVSHTS